MYFIAVSNYYFIAVSNVNKVGLDIEAAHTVERRTVHYTCKRQMVFPASSIGEQEYRVVVGADPSRAQAWENVDSFSRCYFVALEVQCARLRTSEPRERVVNFELRSISTIHCTASLVTRNGACEVSLLLWLFFGVFEKN